MPKIIENLREQLLAEAKKQIAERGYAGTTIRSVASACGVGVGTVYNYFPSKEMLIANFVFEDWKNHLHDMSQLSQYDPRELLEGIYRALQRFTVENEKLFSDTDAAKLISGVSVSRHRLLREQIAGFVLPLVEKSENAAFTAAFVAESLITWSVEGLDFETVYRILKKII
jgi:AcrR family transcriptional regulator